jgi:hypothetical protein
MEAEVRKVEEATVQYANLSEEKSREQKDYEERLHQETTRYFSCF